jgi:lipopolysaccharide/colanic/teichoic acid biosynthesis glycosyltransferase
VIFRQSRVGHRGRSFRIFKFRTMRVDAEAHEEAEREATGHSGVFYKSACDSRITRVGKFLRASSIDELPQLFNVLGGSMSIVGPRPLVPGEGDSVEDFVERRGLVKPGITGLWQISGRSDVSEEERIRLDHSYVDNWSCIQDLHIVWRTARAVLKRDGAY